MNEAVNRRSVLATAVIGAAATAPLAAQDSPDYSDDPRPDRVHELIEGVRARRRGDRRLLAGTSYVWGTIPGENVVRASDFLLLHGDGVADPGWVAGMVRETRRVPAYRSMPILFNEDDHFDFDRPENNFEAALSERA